jgi:hypothetical protein
VKFGLLITALQLPSRRATQEVTEAKAAIFFTAGATLFAMVRALFQTKGIFSSMMLNG